MIIRLIPPIPYPHILFSLAFKNLPDSLHLPQSWHSQLAILSIDDLDHPHLIHSLDKSTAITSLLHQVVFDITTLTVSCTFVDGLKEEWPLIHSACAKALDSIITDVNHSSHSDSSHPTKHKKQRSLLMSLVASFVPRSSSASPPLPSPPLSPLALQRRACATLVDTYRLYVLSELNHRLPPGGYYSWIANSMLRQITATIAQLVHHTPSDDQEGQTSEETDTDGSSLHTPSSSSFHSPIFFNSDSPPSPKISPTTQSLSSYTLLSKQALRLRHLLILAASNHAHEARESHQREAMLEIRCKRRAWLNKRLVPASLAAAGVKDGGLGMAMPFERSPLGLTSWLPEDLDDGDDGFSYSNHTVQAHQFISPLRKKFERMELFPVSEEEEEDEDDEDLDIDLELDLEEVENEIDIVLDRPQILPRIRPRTTSIHHPRHSLHPIDFSFPHHHLHHHHHHHPITPGSLPSQPLKGSCAADVVEDVSADGMFFEDKEFTLAMDSSSPFNARAPRESDKRWIPHPLGVVDCR